MKSMIWMAATGLLLAACAPTSQLQLSSGRIGCAASEIVIGDVASTRHAEAWSATCRGQTFFCSATDDFREVICRPQVKAVAAVPVAAPAPVAAAEPVKAEAQTIELLTKVPEPAAEAAPATTAEPVAAPASAAPAASTP